MSAALNFGELVFDVVQPLPQTLNLEAGVGSTGRFMRTYNPNHKSTYNLLRSLSGLISTDTIGGMST